MTPYTRAEPLKKRLPKANSQKYNYISIKVQLNDIYMYIMEEKID